MVCDLIVLIYNVNSKYLWLFTIVNTRLLLGYMLAKFEHTSSNIRTIPLDCTRNTDIKLSMH